LTLLVLSSGSAFAQKTDVVRLANGDRFTGEVKSVKKGQLELSTDDAGTIYLEWVKIASVESPRQFDVTAADGRRLFGSLVAGSPGTVIVHEAIEDVSLQTTDVTTIIPIGAGFWKRIDGSLDLGFSYTRSSHIAQTSISSNTVYRVPAFEARVAGSATLTKSGDEELGRSRHGSGVAFALCGRACLSGRGGFESNESLGLTLRSQLAARRRALVIPTARSWRSAVASRGTTSRTSMLARRRTWRHPDVQDVVLRMITPKRTSTSASSTTRV
jgi:hypothetical protein